MKKILNVLKNRRYISLFAAFLLLFTYLAALRGYIYENVNKSIYFIQTGTPEIAVSDVLTATLTAGAAMGAIVCVLARGKLTERTTTVFYIVGALLGVVILFFTPYNLQLAAPATNLQNLSTINLILLIFLGALESAVLTFAVGSHIVEYLRDGSLAPLVALLLCAAVAAALALLSAKYGWRFPLCTGIYACVLLVLNTVRGFVVKEGEKRIPAPVKCRQTLIVCALLLALTIGVAVGGYFIG